MVKMYILDAKPTVTYYYDVWFYDSSYMNKSQNCMLTNIQLLLYPQMLKVETTQNSSL